MLTRPETFTEAGREGIPLINAEDLSPIDNQRLRATVAMVSGELHRAYPDLPTDLINRTVQHAAEELAGATQHPARLPAMIRRRATARLHAQQGTPDPIQAVVRIVDRSTSE
jgi:hypothetical protein